MNVFYNIVKIVLLALLWGGYPLGMTCVNAETQPQDARDSMFYEALRPYGQWLWRTELGWVWSPRQVSADWRPYNEGHSNYTPWGWACSHSGRWFFDRSHGWLWSPETGRSSYGNFGGISSQALRSSPHRHFNNSSARNGIPGSERHRFNHGGHPWGTHTFRESPRSPEGPRSPWVIDSPEVFTTSGVPHSPAVLNAPSLNQVIVGHYAIQGPSVRGQPHQRRER